MTARGFLGAGDVWINRYDPVTNALTGWVGPLEASKCGVKPNAELKELISKGRSTYGQVIETVALQQPADFTLTLREANKDNLTLMFMGEQSTLSSIGAAITDEAITMKAGFAAQLANQNIDAAGFVLSSSPAGTTYVENTDFTVNRRLGLVQAIAGSALATAVAAAAGAGLPLLADYTHTSLSGDRVRGAVQPQLRAWVKFDGKNLADNRSVIAEIYEVVLTPNAEFDFLADDWNELPMTGRMKTPTGRNEPFVVDFRN